MMRQRTWILLQTLGFLQFEQKKTNKKMLLKKERIPGRPADSTDLCKSLLETNESDSEVLYMCPQPPAFDHLLTLTSSCHHLVEGSRLNADQAPCGPFYLRVHVRGAYKMWNKTRQFKVRTTSRRATPLGDPRGVPKLFRKCSSLKRYRIAYDKFQDILHLKFESSLRFLVIGVKAKHKIYKVILDIDKMSDFVPEADLPKELLNLVSDFEVASDINPVMDQFDPKELDELLNNSDIDLYDNAEQLRNISYAELPFAPEDQRTQADPMMVTPPPEVNIHQNLDLVWTMPWSPPPQDLTLSLPSPPVQEAVTVHVPVIEQPHIFTLSVLDDSLLYSNAIVLPLDNITQPAASATTEVVMVNERRADLQRRNNRASVEYRNRKKVKKEQEEAEVQKLERINIELAAKVRVMEEVIRRMKDNYFDMIRSAKRQ